MVEQLYRGAWTAGVWLRNRAKSAAILGPVEPILLWLAPRVFPAPKEEVVVKLSSGMIMHVPPRYPVARSYSAGLYEPDVTRLFDKIIERGMTVIDAGANVGYFTLLTSGAVGAAGQVYAFEPDPTNYAYLSRNIEANNCTNIQAFKVALGSMPHTGWFVPDRHGAEGYVMDSSAGGARVEIQIATLDEIFRANGWPGVDVIKLDIEGSEADALQGMRELSSRNPNLQLIMELNASAMSRSGSDVRTVANLLGELGFVRGYVIERGHRSFRLEDGLPNTRATYNLHLVKVLD